MLKILHRDLTENYDDYPFLLILRTPSDDQKDIFKDCEICGGKFEWPGELRNTGALCFPFLLFKAWSAEVSANYADCVK